MHTLVHTLRSHIIRTFDESGYETIEISGPQMVLTMKLTTFAWNVWDGRRPAEVRLLTLILRAGNQHIP